MVLNAQRLVARFAAAWRGVNLWGLNPEPSGAGPRCPRVMIEVIIAYEVSALFLIELIARAPEGYEDEGGFHYARKDHRREDWD
jgi:hypothetical protein